MVKDLTTSDYGVGQVWAAIGADRFLLDQRREQMDMPRAVEAIRAMSEKWPDAAAGQKLRAQHSDAGGDLNRRKPVNCCPAATERCGGCTQEQPR